MRDPDGPPHLARSYGSLRLVRASPRRRGTRYPFAALLALIHCDESTVKHRLGLDHRQVSRYLRDGLTEKRADELADAAGYMAYEVWPEMLEAAVAANVVECASTDCAEVFVPRDALHRFHSETCRQREKMRRYRATPEGAESSRRARRRYLSDPKVRAHEAKVKRRARAEERRKAKARLDSRDRLAS